MHRGTKMGAKINSAQMKKCSENVGFRHRGKEHQFSAALSEHERKENEYV